MKTIFFCTETHGGGAWKRFDFTLQNVGKDCPQGNAVLYATDPGDFLAFTPGKMYAATFEEVKDDQSKVREEPQGPPVDVEEQSDLGVLVEEKPHEEGQPQASPRRRK